MVRAGLTCWGLYATVACARDSDSGGATLNGAYGFYRTGTTSVGPLPAVGLVTFDGAAISLTPGNSVIGVFRKID